MNHLTHIWQLVVRHEQLFKHLQASTPVNAAMGWTLAFVSGAEIVFLCHPSMIAPHHLVFCCEYTLK